MPKVSFIVAVYNSMPYLEQCLDSLRKQTLADIEIICVNDCSPDNSLEYIVSCAKEDSRIKYVTHNKNKRQGGAWNTGVRMATSDYLCFVDADDWLEKDYAETAMKCVYDTEMLYPDTIFHGDVEASNINKEKLRKCHGDIFLYSLLYGFSFISCFVKKRLLLDNNFEFVEGNMYQDLYIITLLCKAQNVSVFHHTGYHYRVDNVSIQRSMNQNGFWGRLEVAHNAYKECKDLSVNNKYSDAIDFRFYRLFYRNTLIRAFYGFTILPWDKINDVMETTKKELPSFRENQYYSMRYEGVPILQRFPIFLFEYAPKWFIVMIHKLYLMARRVLKR